MTELRKVLGIFSFNRRFVKSAVERMAPFYELLKGRTGKNDKALVTWTPELTKALGDLKSAFVNYTLLNFLNNELPTQLACDASGSAVGDVLEEIEDGQAKPIAFYSEKLKKKIS